jgi:putative endonuclease
VSFWTYILCNKPRGTFYVDPTDDLVRRIFEHREGVADGFTKRYGIKRLVYFEEHATREAALTREKTLKRWPRDWKIALIERENLDWDDLYDRIAGG